MGVVARGHRGGLGRLSEGRQTRAGGRDHLEFVNDFNGALYIECKGAEDRLDIDFTLLGNLVLGDDVQVRERLVHEGSHVGGLLKNLGVLVTVDEGKQLVKDTLDVADLFKVRRDHRHFSH